MAQKSVISPYAIFGDDTETLEAEIDTCQQNGSLFHTDNASNYISLAIMNKSFCPEGFKKYTRISFTTIDPKAENYYNINPYSYCLNNPINAFDPDGEKTVFVNGYLGFGSPKGGAAYWNGKNSKFVKKAQETFNDYASPYFTNYDYEYMKSASAVREQLGYKYAKDHYKDLTKGMDPQKDKFNFVSHSMGGAFAEGIIKYLDEQGWQTENAVFLNAWEPAEIRNKNEYTRIDATSPNDPVQFLSKPAFGNPDIPNSDYKIRIKSDENILYIHRDLINGNCQNLWDTIKEYLAK